MKIKTKDFLVPEGKHVNLKKWPTVAKSGSPSKKEYQKTLGLHVERMSELQNLHYASNRNALLLIFQGMDGAGKDGTIKHVMSGVNPQGCQVFSFKHPSSTELQHDFLWRTTQDLPVRGKIGIFNRSYYEEVLITRVHPEILASEGLENDVRSLPGNRKIWEERYRSIVNLEEHLHRNGTQIIKFFLHISEEEQRKRFLDRIDDPRKNWKLSDADLKERPYWDRYMKVFGECLSATSTRSAPWYVIPADDKPTARLIVSKIILDVFESFKMEYPKVDAFRLKELKAIRKQLGEKMKNRNKK
jgi:PPK2 family polyphosphate:nucleotide phosphotransferase